MSFLWLFGVAESLKGLFPHYVKGQGELDIDSAEN